MITSLVTGGAGFIGSHVVKHLLGMGHKVAVLDNLSGGRIANLPPRTWDAQHNPDCTLVEGSILDLDLIDELFQNHQFDYIFHLAAYAAENLSHWIRHYNYEVNLLGSINIINAAVNFGVKRIVFTSSHAVYGRALSYNQPECPIDPYGIAKQAVELDLKAAGEMFDLHYTIFRPYNVYGPGQNLNDPYRNVAGIFVRKALLGEPLTIFGDGLQTRCFTYIDDVAPRIAHSIEHRDMLRATADIGARKPLTVLSIARKIIELTGSKSQIVHLPPRQEVKEAWAGMTPYSGYTEFDAGIQKMIDWARTQELRAPEPFAEIEIEKNLPEVWRKMYVHRESD